MIKGIANKLSVYVKGAGLTSATKLEFYIRQGALFLEYTPTAIDDENLVVNVPKEDADKFLRGKILCQLVFTDKDGNSRASQVKADEVVGLLKEEGYGA